MTESPRIFIGGTGRSGTSILYRVLAAHEQIHAFQSEMRFVVDPDGIINLVDAFTRNFSVVQAREALYKFERLMRSYLVYPKVAPYKGYNLPKLLGGEYYWTLLDRFCNELTWDEFEGYDLQSEPNEDTLNPRVVRWAWKLQNIRLHLMGKPENIARLDLPRTTLKIPKYFKDRKELVHLTSEFVDDLFNHAARINGKGTWCEKTPSNLLNLDFLWELFPDSVFIHMKRDPRGVIQSYQKQYWAPSDLRQTCLLLQSQYERWFTLKALLNFDDHRYIELKLEDLATNPEEKLTEITQICGLKDVFENSPEITQEKVNYWQRTMPKTDIQLVNDMLGEYIEKMGYQ